MIFSIFPFPVGCSAAAWPALGSLRFYLGSAGLLQQWLRPQDHDTCSHFWPALFGLRIRRINVFCWYLVCQYLRCFEDITALFNILIGLCKHVSWHSKAPPLFGSLRLRSFFLLRAKALYFEASESVMAHLQENLNTGRSWEFLKYLVGQSPDYHDILMKSHENLLKSTRGCFEV